jgi:TPR repeat protein
LGYAEAMCEVGWMFEKGNGVAKDNSKAFEWMLKSAQQGYARAQNNIGLYYHRGRGTPVDIRKAMYWLARAEQAKFEKLAVNTLKSCRMIKIQAMWRGKKARQVSECVRV